MTTLASATLELARILFDTVESTATGGTATTLVDTARFEPEDYFDDGTLWILSGTHAGKSRKISSWALSTKTFTYATTSTAVSAGDKYAATPKDFPLSILIQAVNEALETIGPVPVRNTALESVANQEAYTLPAGVYNVKRVEVATNTETPYEYAVNYHWMEIGGEIVFDTGRAPQLDGYKIRLTYLPLTVTDLSADSDAVSDYIHIDLLKWTAAVHALRWKVRRYGDDPPNAAIAALNEAINTAFRMKRVHPIPAVKRDPHLAAW